MSIETDRKPDVHGERFYPQTSGEMLPIPPGPPATVTIARTTERYRDRESIYRLTKEALKYLGGMPAFVKPGQSVLIKPNQTGGFLADEGITTDPRLVGALVRMAFEAGAGKVVVAESSGLEDTNVTMQATGVAPVARAEGAAVISLDDAELRDLEIPEGRAVQSLPVPVPLLEADVIINACKGKTHHMDPISGAIKNWVGAVPKRVRIHHHDEQCFTTFVDLISVLRPALNVCDAIVVGEGDGPVANTPRWCGCVLASTDPVALDATICRLFSLDPAALRFAREAAERGLGSLDAVILGTGLEQARIEVRRPRLGWDYYPFNIIVGTEVTYAGTLGHFKSIADAFLKDGTWVKVIAASGVPTILIGKAEDPDFERHVRQGRYIVIDDAAPARYRLDPRVHFLPGHPVLHTLLPELLKGLGVSAAGMLTQQGRRAMRIGESRMLYVPAGKTVKDLGIVALAALAAYGLVRRLTE